MSAEKPSETADRLVDCPECGLPAEIVDRFTLAGAPEPVEHVKLVCVAGHWFTPPVDVPWPEGRERRIGRRRSRARLLSRRLREVWDELDHAQRRMFEIQTGLPETDR